VLEIIEQIVQGSVNKEARMKKGWIGLIVFLVLLAAGGGYYYYTRILTPAEAQEEPTLQTTQVYRGDIVISADGTGNLLPAAEVEVGFQTSGLLVALEVEVGDRVEASQVLARLDTQELELELAKAQLQLDQAQASLDKLLVGPEDASVTVAQSNLAQAVISQEETLSSQAAATEQAWLTLVQKTNALRDAQSNYENIYWENRQMEESLAKRGQDLPDERVDAEAEAWRAVENAEAAMEQARLSYEQALEQEETSNAKARVQVVSAQANLDALFVGASEADVISTQASLEQARLSLEQAQLNLKKAVLRAPIGGTVLAVEADVGEQVGTSVIITLADLDTPLLRFWVEESDMSAVAVGNQVNVVFEALPDLTYLGEIIRVDPALVTVDNTPAVQAWATLDLSAHPVQLLSGMAAEVEVIEAEARDVLLVPLQALRELGEGQYAVFVVGADGELEMRLVEVGLQDFVNAEIRSGLQAGEVVNLGEEESSSDQSADQETAPGGMVPGMGPLIGR
jgi:RND family efflux transporter MFP subunit